MFLSAAVALLLIVSAAVPVVYTANKKASGSRFGLNAWDDIPQ